MLYREGCVTLACVWDKIPSQCNAMLVILYLKNYTTLSIPPHFDVTFHGTDNVSPQWNTKFFFRLINSYKNLFFNLFHFIY